MKIPSSLIMISLLFNCQAPNMNEIDFQGHRGCRGLLPENSIPAFLKALEFPIKTLEMDAAISKDGKVIISHDPWFNPAICSAPVDSNITDLRKAYIKDFTYDQIKSFDCGSKGNPNFEEQKAMKVHKPSLEDVVHAVNKYCTENNREIPFYNIEIKSSPEWDEITYEVEEFARIMINELKNLRIKNKSCIQSFDIRALQAAHEIDSSITLALLIGDGKNAKMHLNELGFIPKIYSPFHKLVNRELVNYCREQKMKLIPWTVNSVNEMVELIQIGVDGIITDYPNLIELSQEKAK